MKTIFQQNKTKYDLLSESAQLLANFAALDESFSMLGSGRIDAIVTKIPSIFTHNPEVYSILAGFSDSMLTQDGLLILVGATPSEAASMSRLDVIGAAVLDTGDTALIFIKRGASNTWNLRFSNGHSVATLIEGAVPAGSVVVDPFATELALADSLPRYAFISANVASYSTSDMIQDMAVKPCLK